MALYSILIVVLVGIDQLIKVLTRIYLAPGDYIEVIPNFIHLTYQENKGISFSLLSNLPEAYRALLLAGVTGIIVIGFIIYAVKHWDGFKVLEKLGYSLILAGAIGNLIDRVFRHQVTDYMHFHIFDYGLFVNNFADDLVSIGFILILIQLFLNGRSTKK